MKQEEKISAVKHNDQPIDLRLFDHDRIKVVLAHVEGNYPLSSFRLKQEDHYHEFLIPVVNLYFSVFRESISTKRQQAMAYEDAYASSLEEIQTLFDPLERALLNNDSLTYIALVDVINSID